MNKRSGKFEESFFEESRDRKEYEIDDDRFFAKFESPEQYVKVKLRMLKDDMRIRPTEEELTHLGELKTEAAIDAAVRSIIDRHWSREW